MNKKTKYQKFKASFDFKGKMLSFKEALAQEKQETIEMLSIYRKLTLKKASKSELKIANAQFFDLLKGTGLGIFALLPFAPITIPLLLKLGKMVGVELLPTSFNKKKD
ncbi:MAG: hypothetical protein ACPGTQ_01195 [Colwellia sp.]